VIYCGDNMKILESLDSHSIDSVCTDPPYALNFMGKKWDADVPSVELWAEVLRVLKPGGHVLSFGGTRTYHRMVVNIEDAGFEIRDQLQWIYGSGFPKSHNISKAIDKKYGAKREVVGTQHIPGRSTAYSKGYVSTENDCGGKTRGHFKSDDPDTIAITKPSTDQAKQWDGFGTALKPSNEPIVLARKPLSEKTIVDNVLKHGVGALNIDGCRIGPPQNKMVKGMSKAGNTYSTAEWDGSYHLETQGRWPANTLFDWEAAQRLDEQSGVLKSGARTGPNKTHSLNGKGAAKYGKYDHTGGECNASEGGASRFFYCAKASKSERNAGLEVEQLSLPGSIRWPEHSDTLIIITFLIEGDHIEKFGIHCDCSLQVTKG